MANRESVEVIGASACITCEVRARVKVEGLSARGIASPHTAPKQLLVTTWPGMLSVGCSEALGYSLRDTRMGSE